MLRQDCRFGGGSHPASGGTRRHDGDVRNFAVAFKMILDAFFGGLLLPSLGCFPQVVWDLLLGLLGCFAGWSGTFGDGCYDAAEGVFLVANVIAGILVLRFFIRRLSVLSAMRAFLSYVSVATSLYHLVVGEPWSDELDEKYLQAINSREQTVVAVAVVIFAGYSFALFLDIKRVVGIFVCKWGRLVVAAGLLLTVLFAAVASHMRSAAYAEATDWTGLVVGLVGVAFEVEPVLTG